MGEQVTGNQAPSTDPLMAYIYHQTTLEFLGGICHADHVAPFIRKSRH
jgi:hypothetical protein